MRIKAVKLLVEDALPEDIRGSLTGLDAGSMGTALAALAREHPDKYAEVSKRLSDIGRQASYWQGETLKLSDVRPVIDTKVVYKAMDAEVAIAKALHKNDPEAYKEARGEIWQRFSDRIQKETMSAAVKQGNNLGFSVASGARGKPAQLQSMLSTPGTYSYSGGVIPMFIRNGFNTGMRPAEYLAGAYGTRESIIQIKTATAKGGYLGKLMAQAATPIIVTEQDCGVKNGIDLSLDDESLKNRVLARDIGGYEAGTTIDRSMLSQLRKSKDIDYLIVRSALTCQSKQGVCAKCAGADPRGNLPSVGEAVGITGANALAEPIAQGSLGSKHTAGQTEGKREYGGFDVVNRFVQTPETFEDRAVVAEHDGKVTKIEDAAQGGSYVTVGDDRQYILPGYPISVGVGDQLEAGDQIADGLGDPSDIVRLKGLGAGRRYYSERLKRILEDSGMPTSRRNTEVLARAAINHVRVDDNQGLDGILPDDVVSYERMRELYTPPENTEELSTADSAGRYLQDDALHYTIGSRVTPSMIDHLKSRGYDKLRTSPDAPKFEPQMVRLQSSTHNNPDWLASQHTSYLRRQLSEDAERGRTTNIEHNIHYAPRLAVGVNFGKKVETAGEF